MPERCEKGAAGVMSKPMWLISRTRKQDIKHHTEQENKTERDRGIKHAMTCLKARCRITIRVFIIANFAKSGWEVSHRRPPPYRGAWPCPQG